MGIQTNTNKQVDPMVFVPLPVDLDDSNDDEGVLEVGGFLGVTFVPLVWVFGCQATRQLSQYVARARRCPARGPATQGEAKSGGGSATCFMCLGWKGDERNKLGSVLRSLSGSFFLRCGMELVNPC